MNGDPEISGAIEQAVTQSLTAAYYFFSAGVEVAGPMPQT
jgi:hypothetical protein